MLQIRWVSLFSLLHAHRAVLHASFSSCNIWDTFQIHLDYYFHGDSHFFRREVSFDLSQSVLRIVLTIVQLPKDPIRTQGAKAVSIGSIQLLGSWITPTGNDSARRKKKVFHAWESFPACKGVDKHVTVRHHAQVGIVHAAKIRYVFVVCTARISYLLSIGASLEVQPLMLPLEWVFCTSKATLVVSGTNH